MLFLCDESRLLMLTSISNNFTKATSVTNLNLTKIKIKEFLDDVETHINQLAYITEYEDRVQELNNFLDKFIRNIDTP